MRCGRRWRGGRAHVGGAPCEAYPIDRIKGGSGRGHGEKSEGRCCVARCGLERNVAVHCILLLSSMFCTSKSASVMIQRNFDTSFYDAAHCLSHWSSARMAAKQPPAFYVEDRESCCPSAQQIAPFIHNTIHSTSPEIPTSSKGARHKLW